MHSRLIQATTLGSLLLTLLACSKGGDSVAPTAAADSPSVSSPVFDPGNAKIPFPNVLITASPTALDPLTGTALTTGTVVRPANSPMNPLEALVYVNKREVGGTHAVSGMNAPIYIQFTAPVDPATVTAAAGNIKVFMLKGDVDGTGKETGTEDGTLAFTDVSATFSYRCAANGTDLFLFPEFPLLPGKKYMYVVSNKVKDTGGKPISGSGFFNLTKLPDPLTAGSLAALEAIRGDFKAGGHVLLSGYYKVMSDLIKASATSKITKLDDIAVLGRFITTAAGGFSLTTVSPSTAPAGTLIPAEAAIRAFAFGADNGIPGGLLAGKVWDNTVTSVATFTAANNGNVDPAIAATGTDAYWGAVLTAAGKTVTAAPATVGSVTLGSFESADLSVDPVVVSQHAASMDLTGLTASGAVPYPAYNPGAGVTQAYRPDGLHAFGFYHTQRTVPFVYITPATGSNWPLVIFQHGITSQKETVIAVAQMLTAMGHAVIAIDLPLHGSMHYGTHTTGASWGQDFMAIGAPLATRTNIQQAALNLNRMEYLLRTNNFAGGVDNPPSTTDIKYLGHSLGSIVGAYYLASNTTLSPTGLPYTQETLNGNMKGYLSVPGARTAYVIQNSPSFNPWNADPLQSFPIDLALKAQAGITPLSPTYHQFFQLTQSVVDPVDPASMTTPLYGIASGAPVDGPSRLSGRITIQESTTSTFSAVAGNILGHDLLPVPVDGDLVISNPYTRYFAASLGGRDVLGAAGAKVAPDFMQLGYVALGAVFSPHADGIVGNPFLFTPDVTGIVAKVGPAATSASASAPNEGFFQFDQTGIGHSSLLDPTANSGINTFLIQTQMGYFLAGHGGVVDPTHFAPPSAPAIIGAPLGRVLVSTKHRIIGYN
jgi:alpha-beta hydrolase superfamily lysophospholipase